MLKFQKKEIGPRIQNQSDFVIWLHGLGDEGSSFLDFPAIMPLNDLRLTFYFPDAPIIPVTLNNGMMMRAWHDLADLGKEGYALVNKDTLENASKKIIDLISHLTEIHGSESRFVLGGFSQGGAISLYLSSQVLSCFNATGFFALSSYLIDEDQFDGEILRKKHVPFFLGHGSYDTLVPLREGEKNLEKIKPYVQIEENLIWNTYPLDHSIAPQELSDLGEWLLWAFKEEI